MRGKKRGKGGGEPLQPKRGGGSSSIKRKKKKGRGSNQKRGGKSLFTKGVGKKGNQQEKTPIERKTEKGEREKGEEEKKRLRGKNLFQGPRGEGTLRWAERGGRKSVYREKQGGKRGEKQGERGCHPIGEKEKEKGRPKKRKHQSSPVGKKRGGWAL